MDIFQLGKNKKNIFLYRCLYAPVKSNMYIIINHCEAVVVDPNDNEEGINFLKERKILKVHLLITHEHYDHCMGINLFRSAFSESDLFCHMETTKLLESKRGVSPNLVALVLAVHDSEDGGHRYEEFKVTNKVVHNHAEYSFEEINSKSIAGLDFNFVPTPGHSAGSCCIEFGNYVFTGDSLLKDDPVILRFPESNKNDYYRITQPYLKGLHEGTIILPGHGDPFKIEESKYLWD